MPAGIIRFRARQSTYRRPTPIQAASSCWFTNPPAFDTWYCLHPTEEQIMHEGAEDILSARKCRYAGTFRHKAGVLIEAFFASYSTSIGRL